MSLLTRERAKIALRGKSLIWRRYGADTQSVSPRKEYGVQAYGERTKTEKANGIEEKRSFSTLDLPTKYAERKVDHKKFTQEKIRLRFYQKVSVCFRRVPSRADRYTLKVAKVYQ